MKTIIVKTQAEYESLPKSFEEYTLIQIKSAADSWLSINTTPCNSNVEAWGSSHVVARGSSHVVARGSSHVVAQESSHVVAWESSHVEAWESSHVDARGSSHVEARESSHVVARGSSHVVARESSHVVARESSHVEAWESSHVVAWESSHVEAQGSVTISCQSNFSSLVLFGFAVAIMVRKAESCLKKSDSATIISPKSSKGKGVWLEAQGVNEKDGNVILFKRVSINFKTQEGKRNETLWGIGSSIIHPAWEPKKEECGDGKFHACSRPFFCDEFRNETPNDVYIALEIQVADLYAWPNAEYPHKIAFRAGKVLYQCDRYGKKI